MNFSECTPGRSFILKLSPGEILHEQIEKFALSNNIRSARVHALGGADEGSVVVCGPKIPISGRVDPMTVTLDAPMEFVGTGTILSTEDGVPMLHMHGSCGREGRSITGCMRSGIIVWLVMEVIIEELLTDDVVRSMDDNGFFLIDIPKD